MLCDNREGWDEVGGSFKRKGSYVYLWLIHADVWQKPHNIVNLILQLKKNKFEGKKKKNPPTNAWGTGLVPGPGRSHIPRGN